MIYQSVTVNLGARYYPIYIGQQLLGHPDMLLPHIQGRQVMVVTQEKLVSLYQSSGLCQILQPYQCDVQYVPDGEQYKNLMQWQTILDALLHHQHERSTTLIAFGGGMVGDMVGFAAACYLRGVNYIQVPTTVIAQVDAAIGGKTGVNHAQGKNMIGAFYQPQCVIADIDMLATLPQREYVAGLVEVVKSGLICDGVFFAWLEENMLALLARDRDLLLQAVCRSVQIKADIVTRDETEQGLRRLLNLGHTFGHALETASGYQGLLHGEAVAIGLVMASVLSADLGLISVTDADRILRLLQRMPLPLYSAFPAISDLITLMQRDKKVQSGRINLILLKAIGQAMVVSDVTEQRLAQTMANVITFWSSGSR